MSNHSGGYMLNDVLKLLHKEKFFESLSKESTKKFIKNIIDVGYANDCNNGEILEDIGEKLGICYSCLNYSDKISHSGLCKKCYGEGFEEDNE